MKNWMIDAATILFDDSKNDLRALPKTVRLQILTVLSFVWSTAFTLYIWGMMRPDIWTGLVVGHIAPEAAVGGNIALVKEGDLITVDALNQIIEVSLSQEELEERRKSWKKPPSKYKKGVLAKYSRIVSTSSLGAVTDLEK